MAATFYTTRELQTLLQVDRTTIYRMADAGRLPALKVGSQWRFPRRPIDQWLDSRTSPSPSDVHQARPEVALPTSGPAWRAPGRTGEVDAPTVDATLLQHAFPLECVQLIQDSFAEALGVLVLMTDLNGQPVTEPSNACGLIRAVEAHPEAYRNCLRWWAELSRRPSMQPTFVASHLGLLCTRAFVRSGSALRGMVVFGGIAPTNWPPDAENLRRTAILLGLPVETLEEHLDEVYHVEAVDQARLLHFVQRLADIVTHILSEREQFSQSLALDPR